MFRQDQPIQQNSEYFTLHNKFILNRHMLKVSNGSVVCAAIHYQCLNGLESKTARMQTKHRKMKRLNRSTGKQNVGEYPVDLRVI